MNRERTKSGMGGPAGSGKGGGTEEAGLRIKTLRTLSLLPATVGLFLLYLYSIGRDIPVVRIDQITPTMNFAVVRLVGEVVRAPVRLSYGALLFEVDDGSGRIPVWIDREHAATLLEEGRIPGRGDRVDLVGSLSVTADRGVRVRLQDSQRLIRFARPHPPPSAVSIRELTPAFEGRHVQISGRLKTIRVPGPGSRAPTVLVIEENDQEAEVVVWNDLLQAMGNRLPLPGRTVTVAGPVELYRGSLQIRLRRVEDLTEGVP